MPARFCAYGSLFGLLFLSPILAGAMDGRGEPAPLAYDLSAWELAPEFPQTAEPWKTGDVKQAVLARVEEEKRRRELNVYYYRIGYTISYPLLLNRRPRLEELPVAIPKLDYPWMVWLSWAREERWRLLHLAWREFNDLEAGRMLQRELAGLAEWDRFGDANGSIGLLTGHTAAVLALALSDTQGWDADALASVRKAAQSLVERDVWPWFEKEWPGQELTPAKIVNIPVIALTRAAQLARVIQSPRSAALEERVRAILNAWNRFHFGPEHHTEGVNYDGYLFETITEWIDGLPDRQNLRQQHEKLFHSLAESWLAMGLPGRPDLHAPLSDVEPEMPFWMTALARMVSWYDWPDSRWLLHQLPLSRLRAAGLGLALARAADDASALHAPAVQPHEAAYALSLRTGWDPQSGLLAVSASRSVMSHLQADGGHVVFAWRGRCWITDPGYQQYRPGEEREFTLGADAHNAPVIGGIFQARKLTRVEAVETLPTGVQHAKLDLSPNYRGLPPGGEVKRDVWLVNRGGFLGAVVRDGFKSLTNNVEITYHWLGGHHLGWAFQDGWVRLSDGKAAMWIGSYAEELSAAQVHRHPGTRGPLTLSHASSLPDGAGSRWWVFVADASAGWLPPKMILESGRLKVTAPGSAQTWCSE